MSKPTMEDPEKGFPKSEDRLDLNASDNINNDSTGDDQRSKEAIPPLADSLAGVRPAEQQQVSSSTTDDKKQDKDFSNDPNIVTWASLTDPDNPYNWPRWRTNLNCFLISFLTFVTPLTSSIFAPSVPQLMAEFDAQDQTQLAAFVVSVYVLGFAVGPTVLAPLSESYGRLPVYHVCNACFVCMVVGCALSPTLESLVGFRFLAGTFGACPMTNGGGSIADMVPQERRATFMAAFSIGPLIGPIVGPIIGGVVAERLGWRWVFWVIAIVAGSLAVVMAFTMRETYAPVLLERKAAKMRKETGNMALRSGLDNGLRGREKFTMAIMRPLKMLLFNPVCTILAVYLAVVYGYLYLLFSTITYVFEGSYGFGTSTVGLVFLGIGIGSFIGLAWNAADSNKAIKNEMKDGRAKPEIRLRLLPIGACIFPVGFFIYGWTTAYHTHWIAPILGLGIIGIGQLICFMAISIYLVDAFERYAASALAANTIIRSIAGAVLPLCALDMYDSLGLGWGNSLLGFIALLLIPVPFLLQRYGEFLRQRFKNENL